MKRVRSSSSSIGKRTRYILVQCMLLHAVTASVKPAIELLMEPEKSGSESGMTLRSTYSYVLGGKERKN